MKRAAARSARRRSAVALNLALALVVGGVVTYAVAAEGNKTHRPELNDGGVWVTDSRLSTFGRVNKPIGQIDSVVFTDPHSDVDIVQEAAAVVGMNSSTRRLVALDPATATVIDGSQAQLPRVASVQLRGGTLAVLDETSGQLRAVPVDSATGRPDLAGVDAEATPLATVGGGPAALAVADDGSIVVVSAADDTVTRFRRGASGFSTPSTRPLDLPVTGTPTVTTVGDTTIVLDEDSGQLQVVGGPRAAVEPGAVLQQPGPAADTVVLAGSTGMSAVDLESGVLRPIAQVPSGNAAQPVRLGACVFGAWSGGSGNVSVQCGSDELSTLTLNHHTSDLVFRVNRGQILLNDRLSGGVWNIDDQPVRIDNWEAFRNPKDDDDQESDQQNQNDGDRRPPKARPDRFGVRPGRTSVTHPLDNDSAPAGRMLAVSSVEQVTGASAPATISPDGQTIQIQQPGNSSGTARYEYYISDGRKDITAHATMTIATRGSANEPPRLRRGFHPRQWPVAPSGTLTLPVLPDWRDPADSDALEVVAADVEAESGVGAAVRTTADGRLRFTASNKPGPVKVSYAVSDGRSAPVEHEVTFRVQDPTSDPPVAAVAEPDIVSAGAGEWVTLHPLANDLPGADPLEPDADLRLGGAVTGQGGAQVSTDVAAGTVSFRATTAKTYFLDYDVAYGNAPLAAGRIRVDVHEREKRGPVAMPDTATIYGPAPTAIDVLANDYDPRGGVLMVESAQALSGQVAGSGIDVAVIDGRWVRVSARSGELRPKTQIVRYVVSNGDKTAVGEIQVTQRPVPKNNAPVTQPDRVTVRAGSSASIPVLDNDFSPSGDQLTLVGDLAGNAPGQLQVQGPDGAPVKRLGEAFVAGRVVRFVAPERVDRAATVTVPYVAANTSGETAPGSVEVVVLPVTKENRLPEAPIIEGRVVAGDTVTVRLPGSGIDPDGDSVSLLGLSSAPQLGRLVKLGANSLSYQAYPTSAGTEEFDYVIVDSQGGRATGTARIVIIAPGPPQPPLAVPDTVTAEPGRTVTVYPMANDFVAAGDRAEIELVDAPAGVTLADPSGPVIAETGSLSPGQTLQVVYRLSNGLDVTQSTITVQAAAPYNNPPVVPDAFGTVNDSAAVSVDVLKTAYDPDGPSSRLRVTKVYAPDAQVSGGTVTLLRRDLPRVVAFRVEDADGGAATANVYVPASGSGLPFVRPRALIRLDSGESKRVALDDYVANPAGGPARLDLAGRITGSPQGQVSAAAAGRTGLTVASATGYAGPGAVTFEAAAKGERQRLVLSIPVQVGQTAPVLRCPTDIIELPQGSRRSLDITSLCHVFTADPAELAGLTYAARWREPIDGLDLVRDRGRQIEISIAGSAPTGSVGVLEVSSGASKVGLLRLRVVPAPPPTVTPMTLTGLKAGESRTVDLAPYVVSGIPDPEPTVVRAGPIAGGDVTVRPAGGSRVTVSAGAKASGVATFRVVMSDVANGDAARQASNVLSVDVLGVPEAPGAPVASGQILSGAVRLSWAAPRDNGAPIDRYELRASGGATQTCATTSCVFTGLRNGTDYTFSVRAHNAAGWSEFGPESRSTTPEGRPGPIRNLGVEKIGNTAITLVWSPPAVNGTHITDYVMSWQGGQVHTRDTRAVATNLDNTHPYRFTIVAFNAAGQGTPVVSQELQSAGPAGQPDPPQVVARAAGAGDSAILDVSWHVVPPNSAEPIRYSLYRVHDRETDPVSSCVGILETTCTLTGIPYDGQIYQFKLEASNSVGGTFSDPGNSWKATADPLAWGPWSWEAKGTNGTVSATFTVPDSRGEESIVSAIVDGDKVWTDNLRGTVTRGVTVGDNDGPHNVSFKVCNELGGCTTSAAQAAQAYGPLGASTLNSVEPVVTNDTLVGWSIRVEPNGAPVDVRVESDKRASQVFHISNVDLTTVTVAAVDLGYSTTESIDVRVTDPVHLRNGVTRSYDYTTVDPPPPVADLFRGAKCNDTGPNPCHPAGNGQEDCVDSSCGFITVSVAHFFGPVTCTITAAGVGELGTVTLDDNSTLQTGLYFGQSGSWVKAACVAPGGASDSRKITWPN